MLSFGTDGIRGVANTELTPEIAMALGGAVAELFGVSTVLIGRDTRLSGEMLGAAFAAGVAARGTDVCDLGVFPTGGVAFAAASLKYPAAVISASHNPYQDNGIKIFDANGRKLTDEVEEHLEHRLTAMLSGGDPGRSSLVGRISSLDFAEPYLTYLASKFTASSASSLSVVVDAAHGASYRLAPELFRRLGATVTQVLGVEPNGRNINDGAGSTHIDVVAGVVREVGADLGLAFDGDADRLVGVDASGAIIDGDVLLALFARDMASVGSLSDAKVVATVMSNLGLELELKASGIELLRCNVGDRYVLEAMEGAGIALGGEQSGHIIFRDDATTGDGLLSAVKLIDLVVRTHRDTSELVSSAMKRLPQVLSNLRIDNPKTALHRSHVEQAVARVQRQLGSGGRVLVRASGTEPVIRVMVEAATLQRAQEVVDELSSVIMEQQTEELE